MYMETGERLKKAVAVTHVCRLNIYIEKGQLQEGGGGGGGGKSSGGGERGGGGGGATP